MRARRRATINTDHPLHLLLVDGHAIARTGLRLLLDAEPDFCVVGALASGEEAGTFLAAAATPVAVLLTELALPGADGLALIRRARALPSPPCCLVLTQHADDAALRGLIDAGADGCLLKDATLPSLLAAIRAVARGEAAISPALAGRLMELARAGATLAVPRGVATLTARERQILDLLAQGLTSKAIARALGLSANTVDNHRARLLGKLGVQNTAAAIRLAHERGRSAPDAA